jgi:hypothetical protein
MAAGEPLCSLPYLLPLAPVESRVLLAIGQQPTLQRALGLPMIRPSRVALGDCLYSASIGNCPGLPLGSPWQLPGQPWSKKAPGKPWRAALGAII